ncbi:cyclic nucleotide-binding domain-containing protein [Chitinophaga sp. SYP-B3965]|uniref:Crp/Fnr family transcriptional regulator n=1 Tax=Chitinophaga sp. SYP-B3965 TaxID=2663120 RepID=UPI0012998F3E|nr:Crp/Fnr family transcriptional regulator [Chitinophaga sp. SYP-B3965]MRG44625.1 cyclic nucleotide-binding domain-containing protein [Chitinophaga sp. SYP-B3965]
MIEVFKKYLHLSETDWDIIAPVCTMKKLRKQQYLLQEGDVWRYHAFVCKGCLRRYRIDDKGDEHIIQFSIENWWAGDRESLLNNTPSKYNIDAIEDTEVVLIRNDDFNMLCQKLPAFNDFINNILNRSFNASQQRIDAAISLNAEEKYLHFIETFPHLANRVPRHMLASYLGITPETLSRIKNQVAKK